MKKLFLAALACLLAISCSAAERITLLVTVTNPPVTGATLVINSASRYATNSTTATTWTTNLVGLGPATTNLFTQIQSYPYAGPLVLQYVSTNSFRLVGQFGQALSASAAGSWATLTLSTQSGPSTFTALWPMENMAGAETNKTNQASSLIYGLGIYSTNAFPTNSTSVSNHLSKGASPLQKVIGPVLFTGSLAGTPVALTNGFTSALTNINPVTSNLVNYGNAIRSFGSGGNSFQAGSNAISAGANSLAIGNDSKASNSLAMAAGNSAMATNTSATALGNAAIAGGLYSLAVGQGASAIGEAAVAIGSSANANGDFTTSIGDSSQATALQATAVGFETIASHTNAAAFGFGAAAAYQNSTALGYNASTTETNQIMLGSGVTTVVIPGLFAPSGTATNLTVKGTNVLNGRLDLTSRANTSLANGNNAGIVLGTNVYLKLSGPTGAYTNAGFAAAQDGTYHVVQFDNPVSNMTILNDSGVDPTAANRILTGTGAAINLTNQPAFIHVIYDAAAARWRVVTRSN